MLHLHRAQRADRLVDALAGILRVPPADPFAPELIAVPTRGIERWLTQTLSAQLGAGPAGGDGVCANIGFPFPGRLLGGALARASGIDPDRDPWLPERMVWPLLTVIDTALDEPWLAPLASHLASAPERRFARVRQIAGLYDQYGVRRPALIQTWAAGVDATGTYAWQSELWRRLREQIGVPSGAERLAPACARLRAEPDVVDLPDRFALFGLTRLPASRLEVLRALAARREVHLLLLHPSPALWEEIRAAAPAGAPTLSRAHDPTATVPRNRLLASWGRDSRELQLVLGPEAEHDTAGHHHTLPETEPATLLAALQADIQADRPPPGPPLPGLPDARRPLDPADASVRIHACHGRQRQVEVLREAILHRLAADSTLEARDVIVMCPDIETFAPLIQATFGTGRPAEEELGELAPTDLRVRLADRSLRQTNPVLSVVARLLDLAKARLTASQVLDLADAEPIRRRFRLDDDDLAQIQDWIAASGIHWGLDAEHRRDVKLEAVQAGTWSAGLDRILLGAALTESGGRLYERVLPVDDVASGAIALAGRFAELVDRLAVALDALSGPHTVPGWTRALGAAADTLTEAAGRDAWQRTELRRILEEIEAEAETLAAGTTLALPEIRALIGHRLEGRPTRANFRTGHLTICTLVPMRSVPHRVVCLLGLDDGAFPRRTPRNGDDLLLADPIVGDRDPRSEDRQLLLDALLAARDALIVTYSGNDERTNAPLPPAVPVGELLDAIDATAVCPAADEHSGRPAHERVLVRHPLQPFDAGNFLPGRFGPGGGPWSFDPVALEGARSLAAPRIDPPPFLAEPLPRLAAETLALADLIAFAERPARAFLRQRLGIATGSFDDEIADGLPVELDALGQWGVGQRLLEGLLAGIPSGDCIQAEIARGTLPPGALGVPVVEKVRPAVAMLARQARAHAGTEAPRSLEANCMLPDGTRLTGTVSGVRGDVLLTVGYSRLSARHRLAAWVRLLALTAAHPEVPFEAVTIGRAPSNADGGEVSVARIGPLGRDAPARHAQAVALLAELAALRALGMREPLPLPCLAAGAYAAALSSAGGGGSGAGAERAADSAWTSAFKFDREDREPEHLLVFGGQLSVADLLAIAPRDDDPADAFSVSEPGRFGRLALTLWTPLLSRESVVTS